MNTSTRDTNLSTRLDARFIVDSTLRDGEQHPGIVFSIEEKSILLSRMLDVGVREVEIGIPAMGRAVREQLAVLQKLGQMRGARMICWSRCHPSDIDACAEINAAAVHIVLPVSDLQMSTIGLNRTAVIDRLNRGLSMARERFDYVSIGAQDAVRADETFLSQYIDTAFQAGADRVRIADTVGLGNPIEVHRLTRRIKTRFPGTTIEFHAHNDFGLAAANALAALQGGADGVSTTLLGIGERAGNAPFEAVVVAAKTLLGIDFGIDTKALYPLCRYFSNEMRIPISPSHPIVGETVLTHESGIHTHGQLHHPRAYQPFTAETVGRVQPPFVFGSHSGRHAVKVFLEKRGRLEATDDIAAIVANRIRDVARRKKRLLSEHEVLALAEERSELPPVSARSPERLI